MAELVCSNGEHRVDGKPFPLPAGARRITISGLTIEWGADDIRDDWTGEYVFCSFACLEEKAAEWAADHDGKPLGEGPTPEGDGT